VEPTSPAPTPPPAPLGRGATIGAFVAIVVAGLLGATIGAGLVDVSSEDPGAWVILGAVIGAAAGAGGVGVVAVLVLRAMQEWESHQRQAAAAAETADPDAEARGGSSPDDVPSDGPVR
jgi:hypothetical protein